MPLRLKKLKIKYFGCIHESEISNLSDLNIFIGPNNSGKSTVLKAIQALLSGELSHSDALLAPSRHFPVVLDGLLEMRDPAVELQVTKSMDELGIVNPDDRVWFLEHAKLVRLTRTLPTARENVKSESAHLFENTLSPYIGERRRSYLSGLPEKHMGKVLKPFLFEQKNRLIHELPSTGEPRYVPSHRLGVPFNTHLSNSSVGETPSGQALNKWRESEYRRWLEKLLTKLATLDESFSRMDPRSNGQLMYELGHEEDVATEQSLATKGFGEQDIYEIASRVYNPFARIGYGLIDEPENSKHPVLQRQVANWLRELSSQTQLFVATHSTIFAHPAPNKTVHVVTRDHRIKTVFSSGTSPSESVKTIRDSVGAQNIDLLGCDKVLIVEGDTEENFVRAILEAYGLADSYSGIRVVNVGGADKVQLSKVKDFLEFLRDTWVSVFVWLDTKPGISKEREEILGAFKGFLPSERFILWEKESREKVDFEDMFSAPILLEALDSLPQMNGVKAAATAFEGLLNDGAVKALEITYANRLQVNRSSFPKSQFGAALGKLVAAEIQVGTERSLLSAKYEVLKRLHQITHAANGS